MKRKFTFWNMGVQARAVLFIEVSNQRRVWGQDLSPLGCLLWFFRRRLMSVIQPIQDPCGGEVGPSHLIGG